MASLEDTGERLIPKLHNNSLIYAEHMLRYRAALGLVKGKTVLDIASGTGYGSQLLAQTAARVTGVDVDATAVEYAKKNYAAPNLEFKLGNAEAIPLEDNSVDVVISFETIEHVKDYQRFMDEIQRVLKPDGLCVLSTPNDLEFAEGNHFHLHEFTYNELLDLAKKHFKNINPYFQATWKFVGLTSEKEMSNPGPMNLPLENMAPLSREQCLYFYLLCSNRKITETIESAGALGELYSDRQLVAKEMSFDTDRTILHNRLAEREREIFLLSNDKRRLETDLASILGSKRFRLANAIGRAMGLAKSPLRTAKRLPARLETRKQQSQYSWANDLQFERRFDLLIFIHLFDTDLWDYFEGKLKAAASQEFDLMITIPPDKQDIKPQILAAYPNACILLAPNRGRDVLPFLQAAKAARRLGYESMLKLHSKKSKHTDFGHKWLDSMATSLLPTDPKLFNKIATKLADERTGLIGPEDYYITLRINYEANQAVMRRVLSRVFSTEVADQVDHERDNYGFFAGMMFWFRLDILDKLQPIIRIDDFEHEQGQIDGTYAHVFERLVCLVAELQGRKMYEVGEHGLKELPYKTDNIPEWERGKQ